MTLTISKWSLFIFTVLALLLVFFSGSSRADSCVKMGDPLFSAVFQMKSGLREKYRIIISDRTDAGGGAEAHMNKKGGSARRKVKTLPIARITHDTLGCVARCEFKSMVPVLEGQKMGLDLVCSNPQGLPLSSPATLFWAQGSEGGSLRFGTWLGGYQQLPLRVELDRFLNPTLVANAK